MSLELADVLHLLELDKGAESEGPLFQEPKRRLEEEPAFRAQWTRYQALKALALESGATLPPRLLREAQRACRRANVADSLAEAAGEDAARAILLAADAPAKRGGGLKPLLFLVAAAGLGWLAWRAPRAPKAPPPPAAPDEELHFEFGLLTPTPPAPQGLSLSPEAEDEEKAVEAELPSAERRAKKLLIRHLRQPGLRGAAEVNGAPQAGLTIDPGTSEPALSLSKGQAYLATLTATREVAASPTGTVTPLGPTPTPTLASTSVPTLAPSPRPTPQVTARPTPQPTDLVTVVDLGVSASMTPAPAGAGAAGVAGGFDMDLVSPLVQASAGRRARVDLLLPAEGSVDLRVFSAQGAGVRTLADGVFSPGRHRFDWDGRDNKGRPAPAGTYYLRVMTRWSSRVESLEVR